MSTNDLPYQKVVHSRRMLVIGLAVILGIAVTTGFAWLQTNHVILPPAFRVIEAYWKFFICRCTEFPGLFRY